MANSVEIGCGSSSSSGLVQTLYEAIKENATISYNSVPSGYRYTLRFDFTGFSTDAPVFALAVNFNNDKYINFVSSNSMNTRPMAVIPFPQNRYAGVYYFFSVEIHGANTSTWYMTANSNNSSVTLASIYSVTPFEIYCIAAPTYDQLMSQLGGV